MVRSKSVFVPDCSFSFFSYNAEEIFACTASNTEIVFVLFASKL